ncbi:putative glycosidase [Helianthus anomalus]
MASNPTNRPKRRVIVEIGLLVGTTGLCLVLVMVLIPGLKKLLLQKVGFGEGMVHVNGTSSIGLIDEDFICATLDWWPPQKCDYGTCSWGSSSILNLVSCLIFPLISFTLDDELTNSHRPEGL